MCQSVLLSDLMFFFRIRRTLLPVSRIPMGDSFFDILPCVGFSSSGILVPFVATVKTPMKIPTFFLPISDAIIETEVPYAGSDRPRGGKWACLRSYFGGADSCRIGVGEGVLVRFFFTVCF